MPVLACAQKCHLVSVWHLAFVQINPWHHSPGPYWYYLGDYVYYDQEKYDLTRNRLGSLSYKIEEPYLIPSMRFSKTVQHVSAPQFTSQRKIQTYMQCFYP